MTDPNQVNLTSQAQQKNRPKLKTAALLAEPTAEQIGLAQLPTEPINTATTDNLAILQRLLHGPNGTFGGGSIEQQAAWLTDPHLQNVQRQALASEIGRVQGNWHLQRIVASLKQGESKQQPLLTHQQAADKTGVQRECACGGLSDPHGEYVECHQRRVVSQRHALEILQTQPDQRQPGTPNPTVRVGIIPVAEFIRHVETVERSYPTKSPQEILTMIRSLYYGSPAGSPGFDRLIPDAPNTGAVEMCTDSEGSRCEEAIGTCLCVYAQGLAMDTPQLQQAVRRLRQHANENEIADNPSPYIQVGSDLVDVGHLLVGVDAILHPRTDDPFRSHGLTTAPGPATWEGDIGAAMVYLKEHQQSRHKSRDVKGNPSPTVEDYYRNSAPMSDIIGDIDAFGMASLVGPQTLSTALRYYYVSESGGSPRYRYNRWAGFAAINSLTYTHSGNTITWTAEARQTVVDRITRFANLFVGRDSPISAMTIGISPQSWPQAGAFADRFLQDVKQGLEQELAQPVTP